MDAKVQHQDTFDQGAVVWYGMVLLLHVQSFPQKVCCALSDFVPAPAMP